MNCVTGKPLKAPYLCLRASACDTQKPILVVLYFPAPYWPHGALHYTGIWAPETMCKRHAHDSGELGAGGAAVVATIPAPSGPLSG